MKRISLLALILFVLGISSAVAQDVTYNYDQGTDFSKFEAYKWVSIKNAQQVDDITARQITAALDAELAKKGLTKTDADNADLYIAYQTAIGSQKQWNAYNTGWGYGPRWGGGMGTTTATSQTIHTGQLDLDIYDAANQMLVWRGAVSKTIDPNAKPEKRQKNLEKALDKLLKNYPPKTK
ncbi:MAG: DUF4136 domain-containing protein [Candidatus Acidiferrum sp.]